jgi:Mg2+ and Co2+ transporter CorA
MTHTSTYAQLLQELETELEQEQHKIYGSEGFIKNPHTIDFGETMGRINDLRHRITSLKAILYRGRN